MLPDAFLQFHFLRPEWLIALLILPAIWIVLNSRTQQNNDWSKAIDPALLTHLTPGGKGPTKRSKKLSLLTALMLSVLAMAGPTWEEKPQPVAEITDNMVVILDLSLSMLATDTAPDRLTRTKHKLQDLLAMRQEGNTALIAFSGDSHVVTPLTDDTKTILANLPALDPFLMPVIGSRPDLAISQAVNLLEQAGATRGRIIMLTDGVEPHQVERINGHLDSKSVSLSILAAGTKNGAPINLPDGRGYLKDGDQVVIPKTDFSLLTKLAADNAGLMQPIALNDVDLTTLDISGERLIQARQDEAKQGLDKRFDAWEDMGYVFLLAALPFFLLAYRQGALILLIVFVYPPEQSFAFDWNDLWQTADQQGQRLLNEGQASEAAKVFNNPEHKAFAEYQSGQYEQAAESYSKINTPSAHYNRGNALVAQSKFDEAIEAYEEALALEPDFEDAQKNLETTRKIKEELEKQQEQQDSNSDQQNSDQQQDSENQNADQQQESDQQQDAGDQQSNDAQDQQQNKSDQSQQQSNQQDQQSQTGEQNEESEQESQQRKAEQANDQDEPQDGKEKEAGLDEKSDAEREAERRAIAEAMQQEELSDEEKQSFEQWMRRVPDDPGGLLRRKFEQQARERNRTEREQGEPLW